MESAPARSGRQPCTGGAALNACPERAKRVEGEVPMTRGLIVVASLALSAVAFGQSTADDHVDRASRSPRAASSRSICRQATTPCAPARAIACACSGAPRTRSTSEDMKKIQVVSDLFERVRDHPHEGTDQPRALHDRDSGTIGRAPAGAGRRRAHRGYRGQQGRPDDGRRPVHRRSARFIAACARLGARSAI